jgi:hypothetical protein
VRKRKEDAISDIVDSGAARLEFLRRNPRFQDDIDRLNAMPMRTRRQLSERQRANEEVQRKWDLADFVFPIDSLINFERNWMRSPVRPQSGTDEKVILEIDTRYPVANLVPVIEKTLRDLYRARRSPSKRSRIDEAGFQLQVYDAAIDGETFDSIRRRVHRPLSTVKSAYMAAVQKIFGKSEQPGKRKAHMVRLRGFDPTSHAEHCTECKRATLPAQMCRQAQIYMNQDYVAQRGRSAGTIEQPKRIAKGE